MKFTRILTVAAIGAATVVGLASSAGANVAVSDAGVGTIGKGDVQTALGYKNDAAFQADATNIKFSVTPSQTNMVADIKCSALNIMGPEDPFDVAHNVVAVNTTPQTINVASTGNGKVTGYVASGITAGATTSDYSTFSNWSTCPAGEHFMGWLNGPENAFHWETVPGSGVLSVSNAKVPSPSPTRWSLRDGRPSVGPHGKAPASAGASARCRWVARGASASQDCDRSPEETRAMS